MAAHPGPASGKSVRLNRSNPRQLFQEVGVSPCHTRPFTSRTVCLLLPLPGVPASYSPFATHFRMIPRSVRLCLAATVFLAVNLPAQTPPAPAPANPDDELVSLKLPDADIDTVLTSLEALTGRTVLRPAALPTATYNFKTPKPWPKSDVILGLETVLALNGISVAPQGDKFLIVSPIQNARNSAPEMIIGSSLDVPASGKIASKLFQLEFLRVNDLQPLAQGILNPQMLGFVPLITANAALVTDSVSNLQRLELLLRNVDKPISSGMTPKFYPMANAKAADIVTRLRSIFTGTLQQQLGSATTYISDDRTNQVIVLTDPRQYALFDNLIAQLDSAKDPDLHNEVIYLKNAKAVDVVKVVSQLVSGQVAAAQRANAQSLRPGQGATQPNAATPITPQAPGVPVALPTPITLGGANADAAAGNSNEFSALASAFNDDRSNSIVVTGTKQDIRLIKQVIESLDIVLRQVRIEIVIAEVTIDDNHTSGISALGLQIAGDKLVGFTGNEASTSITAGTVTRPGGTTAVSGPWDLAGQIAIGTTPRKSNTTILTIPAIVTSHGKPGKFSDGETRPVITGTTTTAGAANPTTSSNVAQQDIGTSLTVTPFIGTDGTVQLDITDLTLTDVIGNVTVDGNTQYIIGKRSATSYLTAKSGEILVMSGFRKKEDRKSTSRLGPIPFIGELFGTRNKDNKHTELVLFIRPTILTNNPATDNAETMKRVDQLPTKDDIRRELDPNYVAPPQNIIQKILK